MNICENLNLPDWKFDPNPVCSCPGSVNSVNWKNRRCNVKKSWKINLWSLVAWSSILLCWPAHVEFDWFRLYGFLWGSVDGPQLDGQVGLCITSDAYKNLAWIWKRSIIRLSLFDLPEITKWLEKENWELTTQKWLLSHHVVSLPPPP